MNWQTIVQDFIIKHSDQIRKATQPVRDYLDVDYFTYHRITLDGKYTVLVDRPDWAERYVDQKLYLEDPYLRHPDQYQPGTCAMLSNGTEEYRKKVLHEGKEIMDMGDSLFIIEKTDSYVEFYGFASKKDSYKLSDVVSNHPLYLQAFAKHFKRETKNILQSMKEGASTLPELKGIDFYNKEPIHTNPTKELTEYLKEIGLGNLVDFVKLLSSQEKKCLFYLAEGKTAKETATLLRLSSRTVESYLEHIKNKGKIRAFELFDLAKELRQFGLL
jgi:hypothetical protein